MLPTKRIGIGFATGRSSFYRTLRCYIRDWQESGILDDIHVEISVYVAYDTSYKMTESISFTEVPEDLLSLVKEFRFISKESLWELQERLVGRGILSLEESLDLFGNGYSAQRNGILYEAISDGMEQILYLDDDEYPMAVSKNEDGRLDWFGQQVLLTHLANPKKWDLAHGSHGGYVSPIPTIPFDQGLTEDLFHEFVCGISNDIVQWDSIQKLMEDGGVTYIDREKMIGPLQEIPLEHGARFISGSNLSINLKSPERTFPFFNPPGARGEDSFLATCLKDRVALRLPVVTFHDAFGAYNHILDGVLPQKLKKIDGDTPENKERFLAACIGWVRYKPLYLRVTDPKGWEEKIRKARKLLEKTAPLMAERFGMDGFLGLLGELDQYAKDAEEHFLRFERAKGAWVRLMQEFHTGGLLNDPD